jgi:membrane-bound metal-dependent hydrolase YbcI (DUF457 family)
MNSLTHSAIGITSGLVYFSITKEYPIEIIAGSLAASNFPDIDQKLKFIRHRGITHSFIPVIISAIAYFYFFNYVLIGIIIGLLSHMFCDLMNGKGIEILYPISKRNFHILDIKYNGFFEKIFLTSSIIISIIILTGIDNIKIIYNILTNLI